MVNNLKATWEANLTYVYSSEFDTKLNVASGVSAYFRAVQNDSIVIDLLEMVKNSDKLQKDILTHLYAASKLKFNTEYENPNDTAMAVLLWILWSSNFNYAYVGAGYIKNTLQCWYACKLAVCILDGNINVL